MEAVEKNLEQIAVPQVSKFESMKRHFQKNWQLYVMLIPAVLYFIIFNYLPMYGVQIAFKDYLVSKGILGSEWVGFKHFERFFSSFYFPRLMKNTLLLSFYNLATFPLPIIFALSLNQLRDGRFKKWTQTLTYAPHFISVVVLVGMLTAFLDPETGLINHVIELFGGEPIDFMNSPEWFRHLYVWSGVWQNLGWNSIIYIAALAGVNPELHEAAKVDGATKFQRVLNVDLPSIFPTIVVMFLLTIGRFMSTGYEKALLMQTTLNSATSDIIQTYVYEVGLLEGQYSFASAVGLFEGVINVVLIVTANWLTKKITENSLW